MYLRSKILVDLIVDRIFTTYSKKSELKRIKNNVEWLKQEEQNGNRRKTDNFKKFKFVMEPSIDICEEKITNVQKEMILEKLFNKMEPLVF